MIVLGIDPGTEKSGVVMLEFNRMGPFNARVFASHGDMENNVLLKALRMGLPGPSVGPVFPTSVFAGEMYGSKMVDIVFIETIEAMGLTVGKSTLETMRWVGRFQEAWEFQNGSLELVSRGDEKIVLCGAHTWKNPETGKRKSVTDAQIRLALIDKFEATGGGSVPQVGVKNKPGPLFGVKGHAWSALAVALTGIELKGFGK